MFEMMEVKQEKYYLLTYFQVDELLEGMYQGFDSFNMTYALEKGNDTVYREYFDGDSLSTEWASENIDDWFEDGTSTPNASDFMKELAWFGIIPSGIYLVEVS